MRVRGLVLVVVGILALAVPSITYMTTERAVDTSFLKIDYQKPPTTGESSGTLHSSIGF